MKRSSGSANSFAAGSAERPALLTDCSLEYVFNFIDSMDIWHVWVVSSIRFVPSDVVYGFVGFIIEEYNEWVDFEAALGWAHRRVGEGGGVYCILTKQRMWRWFDDYIDFELDWDYNNNVVNCPPEYQWHR